MVSLAIVLCLPLCPVRCPAQTPDNDEPRTSVSGVVLDLDGQPLDGKEIRIWWNWWADPLCRGSTRNWGGQDLRTGPDGEFTLYDVPPGFVRLGASIPDMLPVTPVYDAEPVRIERARPATGVVLRSPGYGATVTGTVMNELDRPVANAVVTASGLGYGYDVAEALEHYGRYSDSTRTDPDGRFRLKRVRPGNRTVWAFARGWAPAGSTLELAERGESSTTLMVKRCWPGTWTLVGRVVDERGASVAGAQIAVDYELEPGQSFPRPREFATTSTGGFLAYNLPPSKPVRICAYHPSVGMWQAELQGREGEYRRTTIKLDPGAKLRGLIRSADGIPLADQEIPLELSGSAFPEADVPLYNLKLETDNHGSYLIVGLQPGRLKLELELELDNRRRTIREELDIDRRHTRHDIVIPRAAAASGRVVGPDGRPVRDAWVLFHQKSPPNRETLWAPDGQFHSASLDPGKYTVTFWARGFWPATGEVELPEGERVTALHLRLGDRPTVSGSVVDVNGRPLSGVPVRIAPDSTPWRDDTRVTDPYAYWERRRERLRPLQTMVNYMRRDGVTTTGPDGSFAIRGVSARGIGLIVSASPSARLWRFPERTTRRAEPVEAVQLSYREADRSYAAVGAVLIGLSEGRDVTDLVIRVAKAVPDEDLCHLRGIVRDPWHQFASLDGLTVKLAHGQADLGEDGVFEISKLPPGEHLVRVGDEENTYQLAHIELKPGHTVDLGELPIPTAGAVEGTVSNAEGRPIGEGTVLASRWGSSLSFSDASREQWQGERRPLEADGTYCFDELGPGFWHLMAVCPSEPAAGIKRVFVNGGKQRVDFRHSYSGRMTGRTVDIEGQPVANAKIDCDGKTLKERLKTETDEEGRFEINGLPSGPYYVNLRAAWCSWIPGKVVEVDESAAPALAEFVLERKGSVQGLLLGPDGEPVGNAGGRYDVQVGPPWSDEPLAQLLPDGTIRTRLLKPGTYFLRARQKRAADDELWLESEPVGVYAGQATKGAVIELPRK